MCYGLDAFLSRNFLAQRLPSLSTVNNTPEEVILCAVLWLFPHHVEAVCWWLWFRLVSLDWIKSVPNQCQEKGTRIVWARAMSSSTSTTLFQNGWETSYIYMCTSGKKKGQAKRRMVATNPEADGVLWKRPFCPLCILPHASHSCTEILSGGRRWGSEGLILQFTCQFCTCCLIQWNAVV